MTRSSRTGAPRRNRRTRGVLALGAVAASLVAVPSASAINYVAAQNGESWAVNDGAMPGVDTGSIRSTTQNSLLGYGGLRVSVSGLAKDRLDGELLRGFGLTFDGQDTFVTKSPVRISGIDVSRNLRIQRTANWARWVDSFTNRTSAPVTVDVSFGGILGQASDTNPAFQASSARVLATSNGDTTITSADAWATVGTPTAAATSTTSGPTQNGTSATVLGTPGTTLPGALLRPANHLRDPFQNPLLLTGHESNFHGYLRRITIQPGETRSIAHFVVIGLRDAAAANGAQIAAVTAAASNLASTPDFTGVSQAQLCTLANWNLAAIDAALPATCATSQPPQPEPSAVEPTPVTSSPYDVVGKTLTRLRDDMRSGATTSQEITRAYLDRIAAYDRGPRGLHSFISVAGDAMAQARAADVARAKGRDTDLLGIPVAVKDLYDTKDQPTTNGSLVFEGFRPTKDAFQIARMREQGAVILGKANMSEFANSGRHSESPWGQVWNAIKPSATSQGSSGGSGVAVAASFAAFSMGSQTGVSLNAPSGASSLVALRGTDGLSSGAGVMPLNFLQDYAGPLARSVSDLATILNVTTGTDPADEVTAEADARRPADWRTALDPEALKGKRIGYVPSTFASTSYGTTGSLAVANAALDEMRAMGAELVALPADAPGGPPNVSTPGTSTGTEGWARWLEAHPEAPYDTPGQIQDSQKKLPYNRSTNPAPTGRMTQAQVAAHRARRLEYKRLIAAWMDGAPGGPVESVVYPNNTSDFHDNDSAALGGAFASAPSSNSGAPEVIVPIGKNDHGHPVSLQFQGRAWEDAKILGFAYAVEQRLNGHVEPTQLPALPFDEDARPTPIVITPEPTPETPAPAPTPPSNLTPGGLTPAPVPAPAAPAAPATPSAPAGAAAARPKPRVTMTTRTVRASRSGRVALRLSCAKGASSSCRVRVTVTRGRTRVLVRTVVVPTGRTRTVTFSTTGALRRSLGRASTVSLKVALRGTGGTTSVQPKAVRVRGVRR